MDKRKFLKTIILAAIAPVAIGKAEGFDMENGNIGIGAPCIDPNEKIIIYSSGNVGIGCINPTNKLEINNANTNLQQLESALAASNSRVFSFGV